MIKPADVDAARDVPVVIDRDLTAGTVARFETFNSGRTIIRFNPVHALEPREFAFVLLHELRHAMQDASGVKPTAAESDLPWARRPWEIDANC